jgi:hypothetical protein
VADVRRGVGVVDGGGDVVRLHGEEKGSGWSAGVVDEEEGSSSRNTR